MSELSRSYKKVPVRVFLLFFSILQHFPSAEANNHSHYNYSAFLSDTLTTDQNTPSFIYISFVGRKYYKQAMKSAYIIETYRLPITVLKDLKKAIVQHQTRAMHEKWTILVLLKYIYFFMPHALRIVWNTILHGRTKRVES